MNSRLTDLFAALTGSFAWTLLWQSTLWLSLGLVVVRIWRHRAARAHLLLLLATVAAVASPLLTAGVRGLGWGVLPAAPSAEVVEVRGRHTPPIALESPAAAPTEQPELPFAQEAPGEVERTASAHMVQNSLPQTVAATAPETPESTVPAQTTRPLTTLLGNSLPVAIVGAWIVCSLALFVRMGSSLLAGRRLVGRSVRETDSRLLAAMNEACGLLAVRSEFDLRASTGARCPMIWCWGKRPILLVPPSAGEQKGISWCGIFCHELAHWLRRDHLPALWTELLVILFPWQPLAWLSRRRLSDLREQACDDWVLASKQEATDYADSLVNLVPQNSPTFALPALRSYESLKRRLEHVLAGVRVTPCAGRSWIALVSLVSLAAATGIALAQQRSQTTNPKTDAETLAANATAADQPSDIGLLPAREENGDVFTVRGRVLKPDGTPAAGARLSIVRYFFGYLSRPRAALVTAATAQADGRFTLVYHPSQIVEGVGRVAQWRETMVMAEADGFGLEWADWQDIAPDKPLVLKLAVDAPIHGRVVDLEGRPVEGAVVSLSRVDEAENGTIDPWLNAVKLGADPPTAWQSAKLKMLPYYEDGSRPPVKTGPEGRFVLSGIGPDRIVELALSGDTIARTTIKAVTRAMAPVRRQLVLGTPVKDVVLGSDFTLGAPPSRLISGTVRDATTGKPLGGVTIASETLAGARIGRIRDVVSQTDRQGRYRLVGMPKGKGNEIMAFPNDEQPYLIQTMVVPDDPGAGPVTVDFKLHRGVWIEGRVFDKATRKPALARLHYYPFLNNPFAHGLPEFQSPNVDGDQFRYTTKADGSFRLVGLPGRAIVGAEALAATYKLGVGASEIKGANKNGQFLTYLNPTQPRLNWPNALKEIDPPKEATTVHCDFALERGESIRVTLVDRESKPVVACTVTGRANRDNYAPVSQAVFDVENLSLGETRPILIEQKERGIGKFLLLKFDEKTPRTMSITLEPSATLVGRILDEEGVPLGGMHLVAHPYSGRDSWLRLSSVICNADGTFKYTGLVPGCDYGVDAEGTQRESKVIAKRLKVEPGEFIDLGDIKLKRNSDVAATTEPRRKAAKAKTATANVVIHGRVVKPDGRRAAGANVRVVRNPLLPGQWGPFPKEEQLANLAADSNGEFSAQIDLGAGKNDQQSIQVWATLPGYGLAVGRWNPATSKARLSLELVEDEPIRGRLIDLQGRPIVDARVVAVRLADSTKESLDDFLSTMSVSPRYMRVATGDDPAGQRSDRGEAVLRARSDSFFSPTLLPSARTNSEGRFEMKGMGRDRLLHLLITCPNFEAFAVALVTRPIAKTGVIYQQLLGSRFERVVGPSIPIEGIVVDEETGKPVAGAHILHLRVRMPNYLTATDPYLAELVAATSDAAGRYRIEGLPSENENWLKVIVPSLPYPTVERVTIPASNSLKPLRHEIKLRRGVWAVGRALDRVTGKPVAGHVYYTPFRSNKAALNYQRFREQETDFLGNYPFGQADADGRFRIPVIPGRGIVAFQSASGDYRPNFGRAQIKEIADPDKMIQPLQGATFDRLVPNQTFHCVREINVPAGAAEISVDLSVDPGQNVLLTFTDAAGRRLSGIDAYALRLASRAFPDRRRSFVKGDQAPVVAASPNETRTLWFRHRATGLTKLIRFTPTPGETERTIVLESPGIVTGRLTTPEGTPISKLTIGCVFDFHSTDRLPSVDTDSEGRFRYELPPGGPFQLYANPFPNATIAEKLRIESGEHVDLGTITIERAEKEFSSPKVNFGRVKRTKTQAAVMPAAAATQMNERTTRTTAKDDPAERSRNR
jgi:beta-lactamase regulating signal transducer with metallopeptidase domain